MGSDLTGNSVVARCGCLLAAVFVAIAASLIVAFATPVQEAYADEPLTGTAYAVLTDDGDFVLLRSTESHENKSTDDITDIAGHTYHGKIFSQVETVSYAYTDWSADKSSILHVYVAEGSVIRPISTQYWFTMAEELLTCDLTGLDTSSVQRMDRMFYRAKKLTRIDGFDTLDTSNVTSFESMFYGCNALTYVDLSNVNTARVTDMSHMFNGCYALAVIDLSSFNTSAVTTMNSMFRDCRAVTTLDASGFDTSNVTNMDCMFDGLTHVTSLDVTSFNTSNVTSMNSMFTDCTLLQELDLSSFDTSNVRYMPSMFSQTGLKKVTLGANFSFDGGGTITTSYSIPELPTPSNQSPYTGKWINSTAYGAESVTARDLKTNYDGSTKFGSYARGTYVWEGTEFDPPTPYNDSSAGAQRGTGHTDLNMVTKDEREHAGYGVDQTNPDENNDGKGDNLAFTVPTAINYVAMANGGLIGPNNAYIENLSAFPTRVSAMQATENTGWDIVEDVDSASGSNLVDVQIGPSTDLLDVSDYVGAKADVATPAEWNMAATNVSTSDQVLLSTSGHVKSLTADITTAQQFGTVVWYVMPGIAVAQP